MNIEALAKNNEENLKKYEYFRALGYGEKASQLLAVLTYGDYLQGRFLKSFDKEARLDKLYAWLLERNEKTPMEAFRKVMAERNGEEKKPFLGGLFSGGVVSLSAPVKKSGARGLVKAPSMAEDAGVLEECCVEPVFLERGMPMPAMAAPGLAAPMGGTPNPIGMGMTTAQLQESISTDSYEEIEEKDAKSVLTSPTSTFRMTTTTASMGVLLNQIRAGRSIDLSQVRIEEVLNYFDYQHGAWKDEDDTFRINVEQIQKSEDKRLLYVNAEAEHVVKQDQNIILLLDVSGSMSSQNVVTQEAIATIVSKLKEGDALTLVTYSSQDETVFENHVIAGIGDKEDIMGRILEIEITGCTNGSAGIETAYNLGKKTYKENGNNQVILITDGDLNFGITKKDGLKELIEEKKKTGLFLSVIGTGLYNYKDDKLEVLSKHGNGTYCVVNGLEDVKRCVNQKYVSLTNVVAKDVKAQVEFNPKFVKKYRLLGYENRTLAHEDFVNDKVISEPYGSGGHGVALYELEMGDATGQQELKYQQAVAIPSEELCTVKVRFKEPLGEKSTEISKAVLAGDAGAANGSGNAKLAYFLYCLSEKLRKSDKLDAADEDFFKKMIESGEYRKLAGECAAEAELLLSRVK